MDHKHCLLKICQVAREIKDLCKVQASNYQLEFPPPSHDATIPTLKLRNPSNLFNQLNQLELPPSTLVDLKSKIHKTCHELQVLHRRNFNSACKKLLESPRGTSNLPTTVLLDRLRQAYEATYEKKCLPSLDAQVARLKTLSIPSAGKKSRFNNEFTPLLNAYFQHNAYPTSADRHILAQKTIMTVRQIEVWFQNHRNRAKKGNKTLARTFRPFDFDSFLDYASLCDDSREATPDSDFSSIYDSDDNQHENTDPVAFSTASPLHAFPAPFPPLCDYDPFPSKNGIFEFEAPNWLRRPATRLPSSSTTIDMETLISSFSQKLTLRGNAISPQRQDKGSHHAWFLATTTIPLPAPLPSLSPECRRQFSMRRYRACRPTIAKPFLLLPEHSVPSVWPDWGRSTPSIRKSPMLVDNRPCNFRIPLSLGQNISSLRSTSSSSTTSDSSTSSSTESSVGPSTPPLSPQFESLDNFLVNSDLAFFDNLLDKPMGDHCSALGGYHNCALDSPLSYDLLNIDIPLNYAAVLS